jgi:hypothetical protein
MVSQYQTAIIVVTHEVKIIPHVQAHLQHPRRADG